MAPVNMRYIGNNGQLWAGINLLARFMKYQINYLFRGCETCT